MERAGVLAERGRDAHHCRDARVERSGDDGESAALAAAAGVPAPAEVAGEPGRVRKPVRIRKAEVDADGQPVDGAAVPTVSYKEKSDEPMRDRSAPRKTFGPRPDGDRPRGPRPDGDRPRGPRPDGDRPFGDRPAPRKTFGPRPEGDRPRGPRPDGDRGPAKPRPPFKTRPKADDDAPF
jgi:hypothetical protein